MKLLNLTLVVVGIVALIWSVAVLLASAQDAAEFRAADGVPVRGAEGLTVCLLRASVKP